MEEMDYWIKRFDKRMNQVEGDINLLMKAIVKFKKDNERLRMVIENDTRRIS